MTKRERKPSRAVPEPSTTLTKRRPTGIADVRRRAEREFLQDADGHTVDWHFENGGYKKYISIHAFRLWAQHDEWVTRRVDYWNRIQARLLDHLSDRLLQERIAELKTMREIRGAITEVLMPLRDQKTGEILRNPETGLPKFALELPTYDRVVKAFLELDLRIGLRTGDVTDRVEAVGAGERSLLDDPVAQNVKLTTEEARLMARRLLLARHAHLKDDQAIDVEAEDGDDEAL